VDTPPTVRLADAPNWSFYVFMFFKPWDARIDTQTPKFRLVLYLGFWIPLLSLFSNRERIAMLYNVVFFSHFFPFLLFFCLQVKMCHLPRLPKQRELVSQLSPIHAKLSSESSIASKHPVHRCNEVQVF